MNINTELNYMHSYLMFKKFPYHSVSVIHRHQDLGFHVIFTKDVKEKVTNEVKSYLNSQGFNFSFI